MKIGLLGGSFDPIHDGHILIAKTALEALKLDELWFIPVLNNPFKETNNATNKQRLEMIEIATRKEPRFKVSTIELEGDPAKKSYTVHTLEKLHELYREDEFFYIIGADQLYHFDKWYRSEDISKLAKLVCLARKGYEINEDNIKRYDMLKLEYKPIKVSSTAIREGVLKHIDKKVVRYFTMNGIYLDTIIKNYMSQKRYEHVISMSKVAKEMAEANGLDGMKAYVAGMLHDIAKEMDDKKATKIMKKHFPEYINMPKPVWHQWLSAYVAKKEFHINDKEILQAIINHTTASTEMSKLDMCIYCADKYDPNRGFDSSKQIALCKENIEEGFKEGLVDFYEFSTKKNRPIDPIFFTIYEKYCGGK